MTTGSRLTGVLRGIAVPPERLPSPEHPSKRGAPRKTSPAHPRVSNPAKVIQFNRDAGLVWQGAEYPVLEAGVYIARAIRVQGPEWVRSYQRWSTRIEFALVHESISVSVFFNMGNDPNGPKAGRMSRFFRAWVIANGDFPRKGQKMKPDVFLDGQFFEVEVESCNRDSEGKPKQDAEVYSRVTRILSAKRE